MSIYEHEKIGKCIDGETDTVKTASLVTFTKEVRAEVCIKAFFYSTENMKLGRVKIETLQVKSESSQMKYYCIIENQPWYKAPRDLQVKSNIKQ